MDKSNFKWHEQLSLPKEFSRPNHDLLRNWSELSFLSYALSNDEVSYNFEDDLIIPDLDKLFSWIRENKFIKLSEFSNLDGYSENYHRNDAVVGVSRISGTSGLLTVRLTTSNPNFYVEFKKFIKNCSIPFYKQQTVYIMISGDQGPSLVSAGDVALELERDNYASEVLDDYDYIVQQMNSKNPFGRLIIFNGKAGSGKSHLVRGLMNDVKDAVFILIQPDMITSLAGPTFIRPLLDLRSSESKKCPIVLILEDADQCLVNRGNDNVNEISTLLNFGDGIFGTLLDMRIIATTNAKKLEMDSAIMRPGRLCRISNVNELTHEKSSSIFNRLTGKTKIFDKNKTLAEIYKEAGEFGWKPQLDNTIGFKK